MRRTAKYSIFLTLVLCLTASAMKDPTGHAILPPTTTPTTTGTTTQALVTTTSTATPPMDDHSGDMDMGTGLTLQAAGGDLKAALQSGASGTETAVNMNLTMNGINLFAISKLIMGLNHPRAWHVEHCRQVPYFTTPEERTDCVRATGWYYNVANRQCEQVSVPCNDIPTLNFWEGNLTACEMNCTNNGAGIVWPFAAAQMNIDPREICITPAITGNSVAICPNTRKRNRQGQVTVWTYSADDATCYKVNIDCHWELSNNTFAYNSTCQHMCHDVAYPNATKGHRLFLPGSSINKTINGLSLIVGLQNTLGFKNTSLSDWDSVVCKQIPYFDKPTKRTNCQTISGYTYSLRSKSCVQVTVPCGAIPTRNFFSTLEVCQSNCTVNGTGIKYKGTRVNVDPREVCIQPVYDPTVPSKTVCPFGVKPVFPVWTYDALRGICIVVTVDCHVELTANVFTTGRSCSAFCQRISLPNATFGVNLFDPTWTDYPWDPSVTKTLLPPGGITA